MPNLTDLINDPSLKHLIMSGLADVAGELRVRQWNVVLGGVVLRNGDIVRSLGLEASKRFKAGKHQNPRIDLGLRLREVLGQTMAWHFEVQSPAHQMMERSKLLTLAGHLLADGMVEAKMILRRPIRPDPVAIEAWSAASQLLLSGGDEL